MAGDAMKGAGRRAAMALCAALGVGGCAAALQPQETALLQQNRYAELRQLMEPRVKNPAQSTTYDLFYLCYAYSKVRQYDRLGPCLDNLQRNIDRGDTQIYWFDFSASAVLMRAQAAIELGEYDRAVGYADEAVRLTGGDDVYMQMRVYALTAAGLANALKGDRAAAERFAAQLDRVDTDLVTSSDKYLGIARVAMALGDHPRALAQLKKDDETAGFKSLVDLISGASLAGESIFLYWDMPKQYMRSKALLETGQAAAAKEGYDKLLARPATAQSGDLYWLILFDRGLIAEREGAREEAVGFYRRAVDEIEAQRASIPAEAGKIGFVGDKQKVYLALVKALIEGGRAGDAFEFAERAKARALVDLLAGRQRFAAKEQAPAETARLLDDLARRQASERLDDPAARPAAAGSGTRAAVRAAQEDIRRQAPELASLVTVTAVRAAEAQGMVGGDETLVEYFGDESAFWAFVLDRGGVRAVAIDGRGLEQEVRRLRAAIEQPGGDPVPAASRALHDRLILPLGALLRERVVFVPHGPLHYLPFAALHDGRAFLVETKTIRLLPSASVARYLGTRGQPSALDLLVLGNPDLGDPALDLPGAEDEARAITKSWPNARVLLRAEASKATFERIGGQFRYLHFATHGRFDADQPLASGLFLAGPGKDAGRLSVDQLYDLSLSADLVTLSACETALGRVVNGDDVVGLTRGFLYAGARSILATLWQIADEETVFLMTEFYRDLKTMGKADALRKAQRAAMRKYPHPYYWSAFQLTGDGG